MTASLDLDALLAGPCEEAKRTAHDAAERADRRPHLERLEATLANDPVLAERTRARVKLMREASDAIAREDDAAAARAALSAVDLDEHCPVANQLLGLALDRMGHLSKALEFYERAWRLDPKDAGLHHNLGMAAWKLDMLPAAEKFYRVALDLQPGDAGVVINLAGVLRDQGKFADAIELLRAFIYAEAENALLWNALGAVLLEQGDPEQALVFFEETLRLKPDYARGWHNLAYARHNAGTLEASCEAYDKALALLHSRKDRIQSTYAHSIALLAAGRLERGWREYDIRLDRGYASATLYLIDKPRWNGLGDVRGKRVLLVGEQGLGDEILFLNALPDLIEEVGPDGEVLIACEPRLQSLIKRTYPSVTVGRHHTIKREGRDIRAVRWIEDWDAIDLWGPFGAPLKRYRTSVEDFPATPGFLTPDPDRVTEIRAALDALPGGLKVGVCWKSRLMTAKRAKHFSPFEQWRPVLATQGVTFVSLQYGDVDDELAHARDVHGTIIHQLPELDLMMDLEGVAALGAALDLSIGPPNASTNLAAAAGGTIWQIAQRAHWPFHGTDTLPWYPTARAFITPTFSGWDAVMREVGAALAVEANADQAA